MKTAYVPFDLMGRTTTVSNCLFSNFSFAKPDFQILSLFLAFLQLVCELINCNLSTNSFNSITPHLLTPTFKCVVPQGLILRFFLFYILVNIVFQYRASSYAKNLNRTVIDRKSVV